MEPVLLPLRRVFAAVLATAPVTAEARRDG